MRISELTFTKYQGNGNDFVIFDLTKIKDTVPMQWFFEHAKQLCHRNRGIGADGLLIVTRAQHHFVMTVINADGSMAKNCGNGLRCVADYLFNAHQEMSRVDIAILDRVFSCQKESQNRISVSMGECSLTTLNDICLNSLGQRAAPMAQAFIGNPHLLIFLDEEIIDFDAALAEIQHNVRHSDDANIGFIFPHRHLTNHFFSRVFERGVGWTESCGTGAVAAASFLAWREPSPAKETITMVQPGGVLEIRLKALERTKESGVFEAIQIGTASQVFTGYLQKGSRADIG